MLQADVFFYATTKVSGFAFLICHSLSYFFFLCLPVSLKRSESYLKCMIKVHWFITCIKQRLDFRWRHSIHSSQQISLRLYYMVCLSASFCLHVPLLGRMPSPFPTSVLPSRRLMHWAGPSGMPTLPIASMTHGTAGWSCATSCQKSRLEPLHLSLLVCQLYFTSVLCLRVKRCQSSCANPLKHLIGCICVCVWHTEKEMSDQGLWMSLIQDSEIDSDSSAF